MSFWLHESKMKAGLRGIDFPKRVMLSMTVLGLTTGIIYLHLLHPKKIDINTHESLLKNLHEKHIKYTDSVGVHEKLKTQYHDLKEQYKSYGEHQGLIDDLFHVFKNSGLICYQFAPPVTSKVAGEIVMGLNGSYSNLLRFFELIAVKKLSIVVIRLAVQSGGHGLLQIDLSINMGDV